MLRNMSTIQWQRWIVYMSLNPQGEEREDRRFALLVQAIWNVQIAKMKGGRFRELWQIMELFRLGDHPQYTAPPPTRTQSASELWTNLRAMVKGMARRSKKKKKDTA
jgi:hypothetical protein